MQVNSNLESAAHILNNLDGDKYSLFLERVITGLVEDKKQKDIFSDKE